jgi:hypothetical protein
MSPLPIGIESIALLLGVSQMTSYRSGFPGGNAEVAVANVDWAEHAQSVSSENDNPSLILIADSVMDLILFPEPPRCLGSTQIDTAMTQIDISPTELGHYAMCQAPIEVAE